MNGTGHVRDDQLRDRAEYDNRVVASLSDGIFPFLLPQSVANERFVTWSKLRFRSFARAISSLV